MSKLLGTVLAAKLALTTALPVMAHEFWIDPAEFSVSSGQNLVADIRVGQEFNGTALSYVPRNFSRFEVAMGDTLTPVEGRMGDRPPLNIPAPATGLAVVLYETTDSVVNYSEWALFERFVTHKGFEGVLERHRARGLPDDHFSELYTRHVKSLIAVGDGAGQDQAFGLRTEFVALANPYTDDLSAGMPMLLLLDGAPRAMAQVELWDRPPEGDVSVTVHHTDAEGRVLLPVEPGHVYMADAVTMAEIEPVAPRNAVWRSIWASLTFEVPPMD